LLSRCTDGVVINQQRLNKRKPTPGFSPLALCARPDLTQGPAKLLEAHARCTSVMKTVLAVDKLRVDPFALFYAAAACNARQIELMCETKSVNVNAQDARGRTALVYVLDSEVWAHCGSDAKAATALAACALECVERLLQEKPLLIAKDKKGLNVLDHLFHKNTPIPRRLRQPLVQAILKYCEQVEPRAKYDKAIGEAQKKSESGDGCVIC
jgi:hypothetical protein